MAAEPAVAADAAGITALRSIMSLQPALLLNSTGRRRRLPGEVARGLALSPLRVRSPAPRAWGVGCQPFAGSHRLGRGAGPRRGRRCPAAARWRAAGRTGLRLHPDDKPRGPGDS